jgi:hypothetical protein
MSSSWAIRLTLCSAMCIGAHPVGFAGSLDMGQELQPGAPATPQPAKAQTRRKAYRDLFDVPVITAGPMSPRPPARPALPPQPSIVCGMTLIPIDPRVDPRIYAPPRRDETKHVIRAIEPPMCKA